MGYVFITIMKKLILFVCATFNACILFAQAPPTLTNTDTTLKTYKPAPPLIKPGIADAMLPADDIVTNITRVKELSTFLKIMQAAGLTETFISKGPVTLFVPTNSAFAKLSAGKLDTLLMPEHKYDLIALITYHAIAGKITSKDIAHQISANNGLATFTTLTGNRLTAKIDANRNIVLVDENGGQSIISKFDIEQNNGLIHLVNAVLIPKFKNI